MRRRGMFAALGAAALLPVVSSNAASQEWLGVEDVIDRLYGIHPSVRTVTHQTLPDLKEDGLWHIFRVSDAPSIEEHKLGNRLTSYAAWQPDGQKGVIKLSELRGDMAYGYSRYVTSEGIKREREKEIALFAKGVKLHEIPNVYHSYGVYVHGFFGGYDKLNTAPPKDMVI